MRGRLAFGLMAGALWAAGPISGASAADFGTDLTTGNAGTTVDCMTFAFSAGSGGGPLSNDCNTVLTFANSASAAAPISGVLVSYDIRMSTAVSGHLRILQNPGANPGTGPLVYDGVGPDISVPGDGAIHTFPLRLPIVASDLIAFGTPGFAPYRQAATGEGGGRIVADTVDGSTPPEAALSTPVQTIVQAPISGTVEADTDSDGFGDDTQDNCPGAGGATNGCPPKTSITDGPKKTTTKRATTFKFKSSASGSTFKCKLDKGPFADCESPYKKKVKPGKHTFKVRATDSAGWVDSSPATSHWKVKRG